MDFRDRIRESEGRPDTTERQLARRPEESRRHSRGEVERLGGVSGIR